MRVLGPHFIPWSAMSDQRVKPSLRGKYLSWPLLGIFVLLFAGVLLASRTANQSNRESLERANQDRLSAIADSKVGQITSWLEERQTGAALLTQHPLIVQSISTYIQSPDQDSSRVELIEWLETLRKSHNYHSAYLLAASGDLYLSIPQGLTVPAGELDLDLLQTVTATQEGAYSGLFQHPATKQVFIDLLTPVKANRDGVTSTIALLLLRENVETAFYPLVGSLPSMSDTAEILLIGREEQQGLLLNQPRWGETLPFELRIPVNDASLPLSQAALGVEGLVSGKDYRDVPVMAAIRRVPGTNWSLVAKIDEAEIYAELTQRVIFIDLLTAMLFLAGAFMAVMLVRQREAAFYKEQYLGEVSRQALSEHLHYLSRYANDIILLTDERWSILEANDRAVAAYGYTSEELRTMTVSQLLASDSVGKMNRLTQPLMKHGSLVFEVVHRRKDGSTFPVECSSRTIDVDGEKFYQSIIRDITERKRSEELLKESERRFRLFYEQAPLAYMSLDHEGRCIDINQAFQTTFHYRRDELVGRLFHELLSESSQERLDQIFAELEVTSDVRGREIEMATKEGKPLIVSITAKARYDGIGTISQFHCILNDVTEQRTAEERIRRMNEDLENRVLERTAQLEAANKELEAFSYSVSHDLRAPLRAIDGFSRILTDDFADHIEPEGLRYLQLVRDNTHTMGNLIDNLLTFSRLSRHPLKKQIVTPDHIVQEALQALCADQDGRQIDWTFHPLPVCEADPLLLKQVYVNLLSNAIKFTSKKSGAAIEVGCLPEKDETIYYVKDNGVGFDMQYAPKIFGVFQRLHRVEDYEGTGVGLAIVQRIIHRHGGRVWAMGEVNQGATFCFTLKENNKHG